MGVLLSTAARNASVNAVVDLIDVGGAGTIEVGTTGFGVILAVMTFGSPAFGSASVGIATANPVTPDTDTEAGTAAEYRIKDGGGNVIMSDSLGLSGTDVTANSLDFTENGTCSVAFLTYTQPAS